MRFVYPILFIVSFLMTTLTPFFTRRICGIYHTRGKEFKKYWSKGLGSEEDKDAYEWCRSKLLIYGFNNACNTIAAGYLKVGDESMSAIRFRTTEK